jgi:predicted TIM-barrel fold metal-dependent hydrolase
MRQYLDPGLREEFDAWFAEVMAWRSELFKIFSTNPDPAREELDGARLERFEQHFEQLVGYSDPERWLREQEEGDGVVASAIYPSGMGVDGIPFNTRLGEGGERATKAMQAYNRWLGDFCASIAGRGAGLAAIPELHDVDTAVEMIKEAGSLGLRGIILPDMSPDHPAFHHPMYDPVWAACTEFDLTLNIHGSSLGAPMFTPAQLEMSGIDESYANPFDGASLQAALGDGGVGNRRIMFTFVYGGIFDRFPSLRIAFTEAMLEWVPFERIKLAAPFSELWYNNRSRRALTERLKKHPDQYWTDHFFFGASFMAPREAPLRDQIGVGQIMWGSDYPHAEGTHPYTLESLRNTFSEVPPEDLHPILGENAARFYGLDVARLRAIADRVGPTVDAVAEPIHELPDSLSYAFR